MSTPRVALVTGASRGIGRALSVELVRAQVEVYGTGRDELALAETGRLCESMGTFHSRLLDVCAEADVAQVVAEPAQLDLCIVNAGIARIAPFTDVSKAEFEEVIDVNLVGAFTTMQAAAKRMTRDGGGRIVVVASDGAVKPLPSMAAYCASKHALSGLSKTLAEEVGAKGVQVTTVYPGPVHTEILGTPDLSSRAMDAGELARTIVAALLAAGTSVRITELHLQPPSTIAREDHE